MFVQTKVIVITANQVNYLDHKCEYIFLDLLCDLLGNLQSTRTGDKAIEREQMSAEPLSPHVFSTKHQKLLRIYQDTSIEHKTFTLLCRAYMISRQRLNKRWIPTRSASHICALYAYKRLY